MPDAGEASLQAASLAEPWLAFAEHGPTTRKALKPLMSILGLLVQRERALYPAPAVISAGLRRTPYPG